MNQEFQKLLREEFLKELSVRTGWGRNDVIAAFDRASTCAALQLLDKGKSE